VFALALAANLAEGLPERAVAPLVSIKVLLVVTLLGIHVALRRDRIPSRLGNPLGVGVAAAALVDVLSALALVGDSFYLVYMVLILMGLGSVLLSIRWLAFSVGGAMVAWNAVASSFLAGQELLHYGLALLATSAVSVAICLARREAIVSTERALETARSEADQRRQAEETLAKNKAQLSLAISASKGGWWHLTLDPKRPTELPDEIELDPTIKGFIGFEDQEFPSSVSAWMERVVPEDLAAVNASAQAHLRGDSPQHEVRYRIRHRDGSLRWIYSCGRIERDNEGRPLRWSGIDWDITDRVESGDRLRKLSRAVEQSSSLLLITDTEGVIEYVNPKFSQTTGYSLEEVIGKTPAILRPDDADPKAFEEMWKTILAGNEWQGEFRNLKKSGEPYWVITSVSPIRNDEGTITHFVAVQEDITERKRVEAQLVQAQRMEGIGQLVSGVAHDFNNLLTGIVGFADLSLATIGEDSPLRVNLEQISKAGDSAMALTRQLLTFSRQQPRPPRVIDLNEVITGFEALLRRTISEDVDLVISLTPDAELISVDPSQIEQVLVNLAVNARDAMPDGGRLTIETTNADLDETVLSHESELAPGRYVTLSFSDSGHGMEEATSRRVFEPFFTTKERGRGTGLGLSTVYGIVKQSGGHIEVESALGKGTTFRIYLPCTEEPVAETTRTERPVTTSAGGERILLVEDDELVRVFAVKLLKRNGYEVRHAESAPEALERVDGFDVDLLLTDVIMPGMNGVELSERLGRSHPDMKVLFLSGYADHEVIEKRILQADATFLAKPFAVDEFMQTVRDLLDG
jgi:PAS domain S-box-containing protein